MKRSVTWVAVADSAGARIFEIKAPQNRWQLVEELAHPESRLRGKDLLEDSPRRHDERGESAHAHQIAVFARQLALALEKQHERYDRLVLVGPPTFLGLLRGELSEPMRKRVSATVNKDFAHLTDSDLEERLQEYAPSHP